MISSFRSYRQMVQESKEHNKKLSGFLDMLYEMGAFFRPPCSGGQPSVFFYGFFLNGIGARELGGHHRLFIPPDELIEIDEFKLDIGSLTFVHGSKQYQAHIGNDNFVEIIQVEMAVPLTVGKLYDFSGSFGYSDKIVGFALSNEMNNYSSSIWAMGRVSRCHLTYKMLIGEEIYRVAAMREPIPYEEEE